MTPEQLSMEWNFSLYSIAGVIIDINHKSQTTVKPRLTGPRFTVFPNSPGLPLFSHINDMGEEREKNLKNKILMFPITQFNLFSLSPALIILIPH